MTRHLPDALIVLGGLAVPIGIGLMHLAAAIVVFGVELVTLGVVIARSQHGPSG